MCFEPIQNGSKKKNVASGLNRGLSSNFWWLRRANYEKFTEECMLFIEKHVLVKKNVYKWVKHGFITMSPSQKDHPWSENTPTPVKKKVPGAMVS